MKFERMSACSLSSPGKKYVDEPTILPSNVEGGLGFVGLETVSEVVFYEKETVLPPMKDQMYY